MQPLRVLKRVISSGSVVASLVLSSALSGCSGGTPFAPSAGANSATPQSVTRVDPYAAWRSSLKQTGLPGAGCFTASYPSTKWSRVACDTPPHLLYPLTSGQRRAHSVGDGDDYSANTGSNKISSAIGSFPTATGITSVKSVENPEFGCCGENGTNSYTLQLNSSFFSSAACNGESNCAGWEQFVYENPPGSSKGSLFIQDWLIPANLTGSIKCPKGKGWESADGGCVQNSASSVSIPNVSITNLGKLVETGDAASSGDSIFLSVGSTEYGMKVQNDTITDLASNWTGAEFNIVGNAGGDIANFNTGVTISVSLQTDDGVTTKPTCPANSGTTGESNNLSFVAAPSNPAEQQYPSILFTESNVSGGGSASCDTIAGL